MNTRKIISILFLTAVLTHTALSQNTGKNKVAPEKLCNFWEGEIVTTIINNEKGKDRVHLIFKTTYSVRLREERLKGRVYDAILMNDGSSVETEMSEEGYHENGVGISGSYKSEGSGKSRVVGPGSRESGSVGYIIFDLKGKRSKYQFDMWPDEGTGFNTTIIYYEGDPPKENVVTHKINFGRGTTKGDVTGFESLANFTKNGTMEGAYKVMDASGNHIEETAWNLKMVTDACSKDHSGDTTSKKTDPCPPPRNELSLMQVALAQERSLLEKSGEQYHEIRDLQQQSKQWKNDYDQAARECTLWQIAEALTNFLVGNEKTTAGEAGKQLSNFLSFLDKYADGDPSWILPNEEYKDWFSAEDAWEGYKAAFGQLKPENKPQGLIDQLRKCGSPTSGGVMEGAINYLRLLQQIEKLAADAQKTLNDIRNKDLEVLDMWNKYHDACVAYSQCKGTDTKDCDNPPK